MLIGLGVGILLSTILSAIILFARGYASAEDPASEFGLADLAITQMGLWVGLIGAPVWAARRKGRGVIVDFHLRQKWWDVPLGLVVGPAVQFAAVLFYAILGRFIDTSSVGDPAEQLTGQTRNEPLAVVLLFVVVVAVATPVIEEVFFRGLLYRSLLKRWSLPVAVIGSALVFGLVHFQLLQLPALVLFGLAAAALVAWTDRLGPAIWAHISFNGLTVFVLLCDCVNNST